MDRRIVRAPSDGADERGADPVARRRRHRPRAWRRACPARPSKPGRPAASSRQGRTRSREGSGNSRRLRRCSAAGSARRTRTGRSPTGSPRAPWARRARGRLALREQSLQLAFGTDAARSRRTQRGEPSRPRLCEHRAPLAQPGRDAGECVALPLLYLRRCLAPRRQPPKHALLGDRVAAGTLDERQQLRVAVLDAVQELHRLDQRHEPVGAEYDRDEVRLVAPIPGYEQGSELAAHDAEPLAQTDRTALSGDESMSRRCDDRRCPFELRLRRGDAPCEQRHFARGRALEPAQLGRGRGERPFPLAAAVDSRLQLAASIRRESARCRGTRSAQRAGGDEREDDSLQGQAHGHEPAKAAPHRLACASRRAARDLAPRRGPRRATAASG